MNRTSYEGRTFRCAETMFYFTVGATFPGRDGRLWCVGQWEAADELRRQVCDGYQIIAADRLDDADAFCQVLNVPPSQWHTDLPRLDAYHPDIPPRVDLPVWRHR